MKSKHRIAEFRERLFFYKVISESNITTRLPEDTLQGLGCFFAKIQRGTAITENTDKRETTAVWNCYIRRDNCKNVELEYKVKWSGEFYEIISIEDDDFQYSKVVIKKTT